jgi:hypothetical protein
MPIGEETTANRVEPSTAATAAATTRELLARSAGKIPGSATKEYITHGGVTMVPMGREYVQREADTPRDRPNHSVVILPVLCIFSVMYFVIVTRVHAYHVYKYTYINVYL